MGVYTGPAVTVVSNQTAGVSSAINGVINGINAFGAMTSYTPTLTGWALGNGSITGAYTQVEKTILFRVLVTAGTTTTYGVPTVSLPVTGNSAILTPVAADVSCILSGGSGSYQGATRHNSATTVSGYVMGTNGLFTSITSTVPFTWASGNSVSFTGVYEAA